MKIIKTVEEMQQISLASKDQKVGFVPTMGYFHEGHISLMKQAKNENDIVVTSIFVNPLQFGPNEDFDQYPRNEEQDMLTAKELGVDILFVPDVQTIYPNKMLINMSIKERTNVLCGRSRPGHFDGVITVLSKLFNIILPDKAYFGMKDAQQLAVVSALINNLNYPIQLIGLPTVREYDGLAKSSRNIFLNDEERKQAKSLYQGLIYGKQMIVDGELNSAIIVKEVTNIIKQHTENKIDYVELLSYPDLQPLEKINQDIILAVSVYFEYARIIDSLLLTKKGTSITRIE